MKYVSLTVIENMLKETWQMIEKVDEAGESDFYCLPVELDPYHEGYTAVRDALDAKRDVLETLVLCAKDIEGSLK